MSHRHQDSGGRFDILAWIAAAVAVGVIADLVSFIDRAGQGDRRDVVDLAGEGSFPASDPPPWTTGREPVAEV